MSFFAGLACAYPVEQRETERLGSIAVTYGGGKGRLWRGDTAALILTPRAFTPEDRLDRLPAAFMGGMSHLVFDGRLDNRNELIASLNLPAPDAARLGDAALVMAALERWGVDACPRFIGAFALAWWNELDRRLVLAVDATGGRAIFAHNDGERLYFATRPLAVLAFAGIDRRIDESAMAHLLLARAMPAGATPFHGVFRLPPAGLLLWHKGDCSIRRYWQPDLERRIRYRDSRDYVEAGREMLSRVVAPSLRATGPVACQLSGGLDSSGVAATAARLLDPTSLHTFTSVPDSAVCLPAERPRAFYDETALARATAALHKNIEAHFIPPGDITLGEEDATRLFWEFGLPVRNFMNLAAWEPLYSRVRETGASVILTGISGNYTLSWKSEALLADLARSGRLVEVARQLRGLHRHGYRLSSQIRHNLLANAVPARIRTAIRRLRGTEEDWQLRSSATAALAASVDARAITDTMLFGSGGGDRDRRLRLAYLEKNWSQNQWLAAHPYVSGCDLRDPLGDRRMVEFCLAIPIELWQREGQPRSFAREVLSDRVPQQVVNEHRRGYQNGDWFHRLTQLRPVFMAELDRLEASPAARRMIDLPRLRAVAEDWPIDADAAMARATDMLDLFGRGIHYGRFIRWVEGSNG
ncbi:MAG: asparagine synthase [Alphaproteobacteria bacterium]|nr:asparagine synthase [Alphaproteobacteria bacterium]MBU0796796.1 asparagine synthase [Alphaproteobacteria bacterium]MBU0885846.1 asparagine synthase [Alphaproteobacteria bacterium]MBU1812078.1 asparagine synthase [Alphaproteobacteria bacterium]